VKPPLPTISAFVLAKNEERQIGECLETLSFADEIVVVDDESSDRTAEIAVAHDARLLRRRLDTFVSQRNFALAHCTGDWVVWVDADERATEELRDELLERLRTPGGAVGFRVPVKSYFLGRWVRGCGYYPNYRLRVFQRAGAAFHGSTYDRMRLEGAVGTLRCALSHHPYTSIWHYAAKVDRYSTMAAEEKRLAGKRATIADLTLRPLLIFLRHYLLQHGFLDGAAGFIISVMSAHYAFLKYAKLFYLRRPEPPDQLPSRRAGVPNGAPGPAGGS
jgi:glycosyltransferase involved in cell wall biosynthesis